MGRLKILWVERARTPQWDHVRGFVQVLKRRSGMFSTGFDARVLFGFTDAGKVGTLFGGLRKEARGLEGGGEGRGQLRAGAKARGDDRLGERNCTDRAGCEAVQKVGHAISI
jgi:hypothetical protein